NESPGPGGVGPNEGPRTEDKEPQDGKIGNPLRGLRLGDGYNDFAFRNERVKELQRALNDPRKNPAANEPGKRLAVDGKFTNVTLGTLLAWEEFRKLQQSSSGQVNEASADI